MVAAADVGAVSAAAQVIAQSSAHWQAFWRSGAAVDFSGSKDPRAAELERQTRSSALQRLKFGLVYRPGELVAESDIQVTCPPALEPYLAEIINDTPALDAAAREALRSRRHAATAAGAAVEYYRRVSPATALNYL